MTVEGPATSPSASDVRWDAPVGVRGLATVLAAVPRTLARRPAFVVVRALAVGGVLELAMRAALLPIGDRRSGPGWGFLGLLVLAAAWGGFFLLGARWIAHAGAREATDDRGSPRGAPESLLGDVGYGAALAAAGAFGSFTGFFLVDPIRMERLRSVSLEALLLLVMLITATLPAALVAAAWFGKAARRLKPRPRPVDFPLQLARFVVAWGLTFGCMLAVLWRAERMLHTPISRTSLVDVGLGHLLPVTLVGLVVAALADTAGVRRTGQELGQVFE